MSAIHTALVALHGSASTPNAWRGVSAVLRSRMPNLVVHTPAIRGCEVDPPPLPPPDASFDELVAAVDAQIPRDGRELVLAAFSFGALVALRLAATSDCTIRQIVLFDPMVVPLLPLMGFDDDYHRIRPVLEDYATGAERGEADAAALAIDAWLGDGAYASSPPKLKEMFERWGPTNARQARATFAMDFSLATFAGISAPIAAHYGAAGPPIWKSFAAAAAGLSGPNGSIQAIPGANHAMLATHANEIATVLHAAIERAR
ncbi:MAG: alpha/beta hydrolase [Acidimicrobiales bacterium]|nr:alpha/beta hydrolase [Acidimicrobiales bacterium]